MQKEFPAKNVILCIDIKRRGRVLGFAASVILVINVSADGGLAGNSRLYPG
jgi:hypothetical protein